MSKLEQCAFTVATTVASTFTLRALESLPYERECRKAVIEEIQCLFQNSLQNFKHENYSTVISYKGDYLNTTSLKYSLWHEVHSDKIKGYFTVFLKLRNNCNISFSISDVLFC